jgi:hypothetical protein
MVEDSLSTLHVKAILLGYEGEICDIYSILSGQKGASVNLGRFQQSQDGVYPIKEGLAALYLDYLGRVIVGEEFHSFETGAGRKVFFSDSVPLEKIVRTGQGRSKRRGRRLRRSDEKLSDRCGQALLFHIEINQGHPFLYSSQAVQNGIPNLRKNQQVEALPNILQDAFK